MPFFRGEAYGIGIDIIDGCNLRCRQCFYRKGNLPFKQLSVEQVSHIIAQAKINNFQELYILGGEPTLHPELVNILDIGLRQMSKVILVTNGIKFADSAYCQKVALPGLILSMHRQAIDQRHKNIVDHLLQKRDAFEFKQQAWNNVLKYWQGKICVQLNLLQPLLDAGCVMEVFKWARTHGFEPIMELSKPGPFFLRGDELDISSAEVMHLYQEMLEYDKQYYPELVPEIIVPPSYGHNCTLVETGVHIAVTGDVLPCVGHPSIKYGNIFQDDLNTMLNSPLRQAIQDYSHWIVGPCTTCQHFDYCRGGCRGEAMWDTGCPRASDPYCWHHSSQLTIKDMVPASCKGCILESCKSCKIKV